MSKQANTKNSATHRTGKISISRFRKMYLKDTRVLWRCHYGWGSLHCTHSLVGPLEFLWSESPRPPTVLALSQSSPVPVPLRRPQRYTRRAFVKSKKE